MAFQHQYIQTTGNDLNAGSTTADAAAFTYAGGTFVRATGVFTVASGNPSSDGVAVGDWVSIYTTAGAVAATFIGKCTARDTTTITVEITTNKLGLTTAVSEGAGATTAKVGGAWASEIVLAATGLGTFTAAASFKINIKAGTYTVVASRTISMSGATTAPICFSGYNTTPGDLDTDTTNGLTKPTWTLNSTVALTTSGAHQLWSGLNVVGTRTGALWNMSGNASRVVRCRVETTSSNAAAYAFNVSGTSVALSYCWFKAPTTATSDGVVFFGANSQTAIGCIAEAGGMAGFEGAARDVTFVSCISLNSAGQGFNATTGALQLVYCTVYNATSDGVKWSSTPINASPCVVGCLFSNCGGYGINNGSGTNTNLIFRACNDFYSCTSGNENGFGDSPAFFGQTDGSAVVTSSTDMTPKAGANARAKGFPGIFENESFSSYPNIGAVQQVAAAGGVLINPGLSGGLR